MRRDHHAPRNPGGRLGTVIGADEVQAQIDPGGHARAGQHLTVIDVEDVGPHVDRRRST